MIQEYFKYCYGHFKVYLFLLPKSQQHKDEVSSNTISTTWLSNLVFIVYQIINDLKLYVCATTSAALIKITLTWFDPITLIYFLYYFAIAAFLPWLAAFFTTYSIVSNGSRSCGVGLCKNRLMHVTM